MTKEQEQVNEEEGKLILGDQVFFPLVCLPAHDLGNHVKLFQWCWNHEIDIVHSCDSIAQMTTGKVIAPGRPASAHMMTLTIFYGRTDEQNFKELFGFDYEIEILDQVQPLVLKELGIENMEVNGI